MRKGWKKNSRIGISLFLVTICLLATYVAPVYSASYNMRYDLAYTGVPFAGGAIVLVSNFTNTSQLTIRLTQISFESNFWNNGTRVVTSGLLFNLTAGESRQVDTPVVIPASASLGNHPVTGIASWQYSNSTGWFAASPVATSTTVLVSQTIGSLLASFVTILIIGLIAAAVIIVSVVLVVVVRRKRSKPEVSPQSPPRRGPLPPASFSQDPLTSSWLVHLGSSD